jgi:hypothetical protein
VAVEGEAALSVVITGTGYPMDTGQEEVAATRPCPATSRSSRTSCSARVRGQYEAFIGTSGRQPFRVFRLGDPERVVVDVRTP